MRNGATATAATRQSTVPAKHCARRSNTIEPLSPKYSPKPNRDSFLASAHD
jgi:hypothetical protein